MNAHKLDPLLNISQHLGRAREDKYLLLDGSRFPDIYAPLYEFEDKPEYIPLFKKTFFESLLPISPCLIRIKNCGQGLLPWFLQPGSTADKGWLFTSSLPMEALAEHFRDCLTAFLPDQRKVLFRFYDPAILHIMAHCVNPATWLKVVEPCATVVWKNKDSFYEAVHEAKTEAVKS